MLNTIKKNILIIPGIIWITIFLFIPCLIVISYSFFERGVYGGIEYNFNFDNYFRVAEYTYLKILLNSAKIAFLSATIAVLIGYPAAYFIHLSPSKYQMMNRKRRCSMLHILTSTMQSHPAFCLYGKDAITTQSSIKARETSSHIKNPKTQHASSFSHVYFACLPVEGRPLA